MMWLSGGRLARKTYLFLSLAALLAITVPTLADECPFGPGYYCGAGIGKDANWLYHCNGTFVQHTQCKAGCLAAEDGYPDECRNETTSNLHFFGSDNTTTANITTMNITDLKNEIYVQVSDNDTSCPFGEGDYCGELIGKNPKELWTCTGYDGKSVTWTKKEDCSIECKITPATHDDSCQVDANTTCPYGDGLYCGGPVNTTAGAFLRNTILHHIYYCQAGVLDDLGLCPNGCETTTIGEQDFCRPQSHVSQGFKINAFTLQNLKKHEGFSATFYADNHDPPTWSIGYGHPCSPSIRESDCKDINPPLTEDQATTILSADIKEAEACLCKYVKDVTILSDNQYGALIDFIFSNDCHLFQFSRVRTAVNRGDLAAVPNAMLSYNVASPGLQDRHRDQGIQWEMQSTVKAPVC